AEFLDAFDLSGAKARIEGEDLVVEAVNIRDSATQHQQEITARFRWFSNLQSLGMVAAETYAQSAGLRSLLDTPWAFLAAWVRGGSLVASAQAAPGVIASLESPAPGQMVSGVSILRGWAFSADSGIPLQEVHVAIDGQPWGMAPCCTGREDVAAAFPGT